MADHGHVSIVMVGPRGRARGMIRSIRRATRRAPSASTRSRCPASSTIKDDLRNAVSLMFTHGVTWLACVDDDGFYKGYVTQRGITQLLGATYRDREWPSRSLATRRPAAAGIADRASSRSGPICRRAACSPAILQHWATIVYLSRQHLNWSRPRAPSRSRSAPARDPPDAPRFRRYANAVTQVVNLGTTIPTLAILAIAMSILGIGAPPAIFGLFVLTLLPIVLNTIAGLRMVPEYLLEAARGMGMTPAQILFRVELPNALFVILAGVRTALAINVGTVPLAFLIGGGGLGELIFTGIDTTDTGMLLAGAIPTALLAILVDSSIGAGAVLAGPARREPSSLKGNDNQRKGTHMKRMIIRLVAAAATLGLGGLAASAQTIVVGGKNFTEQQIMAEMTSQLLKAKGFTVDKRAGLGTAPLRQAQEAGQIDVYWEYTGTSLINFNKVTDKLDAAATYAKVKELDAAKGLVWLNPSKANNTYALAMRSGDAAQKGHQDPLRSRRQGEGRPEAQVRLQCRVLRPRRRFEADAGGLRLHVSARGRDPHGHRPRLPGAARRAGRRRPRLRDRRARAGLQLRHPPGRQGLLPELRHDPRGPEGGPGQEPEARRGPERAVGKARRRHNGEAQRLGRRRQEERRGGRGRIPEGTGAGVSPRCHSGAAAAAEPGTHKHRSCRGRTMILLRPSSVPPASMGSGLGRFASPRNDRGAMTSLPVAAAQIECRPATSEANLSLHRAAIARRAAAGRTCSSFPSSRSRIISAEPDLPRLARRRADAPELLESGRRCRQHARLGRVHRGRRRGRFHNSQALSRQGRVRARPSQAQPADYGRLTEGRHYAKGERIGLARHGAWSLATLICAETWNPALPWLAALRGASLLLVPVASSLHVVDDLDNRAAGTVNLAIRL
jgi:osmoprotectant transport system permease protein